MWNKDKAVVINWFDLLFMNVRWEADVVLHALNYVCRKQLIMTVIWNLFARRWRHTVPTDMRQVLRGHAALILAWNHHLRQVLRGHTALILAWNHHMTPSSLSLPTIRLHAPQCGHYSELTLRIFAEFIHVMNPRDLVTCRSKVLMGLMTLNAVTSTQQLR